jgi:hypothetical protein
MINEFTLVVVDNFGVKYTNKDDPTTYNKYKEEHHKMTTDWDGRRQYIGILGLGLKTKPSPHVNARLHQLGTTTTKVTFSINTNMAQNTVATTASTATPQRKNKEIHATSMRQIPIPCTAVDSTLLCPNSAIVSQSQLAAPTEDTLKQTNQLLNYLATQEEADSRTRKSHDTGSAQQSYLSELHDVSNQSRISSAVHHGEKQVTTEYTQRNDKHHQHSQQITR